MFPGLISTLICLTKKNITFYLFKSAKEQKESSDELFQELATFTTLPTLIL